MKQEQGVASDPNAPKGSQEQREELTPIGFGAYADRYGKVRLVNDPLIGIAIHLDEHGKPVGQSTSR